MHAGDDTPLLPPDPQAHRESWLWALEGLGEGVWDWNLHTGAHYHSPRWANMLGYTPQECDEEGVAVFESRVHPDDWVAVEHARRICYARQGNYHAQFRMRCKDGHWKWILSRGMVVEWDAQGQPVRMIGTHTDLEAQQQSLAQSVALVAQLREQTRFLQTTLASVSQGIVLTDAQGTIHTFNQRLCELLELDPQWLREHPTLAAMVDLQHARGDFGPQAQWVQEHARALIMRRDEPALPAHYLRQTRSGRTLEVRTQYLEDGGLVRTFADVSAYVRSETERAQLDALLEALQEVARVGCAVADFAQGTVFWTPGIYRILDTSPPQYSPTLETVARFLTPSSRDTILAALRDRKNHPLRQEAVLEMRTAIGRHVWVKSIATLVWEGDRVATHTAVMQDITEFRLAQNALRENEERWKLALESTGDGVWDWYIQDGKEFFSPRLLEMYGFHESEIEREPDALDKRTHPDDLAQMKLDREEHFAGRTPMYHNEHRVQCKSGQWKWVLSRGMVISRDAQGRPLRMIGTHTDITTRKEAEQAIRHQAMFDALTGLPNRRMLRDRLEQEIKRCARDGQQMAVLFIDLDHFKEINDTLGHDCGDALLVQAAQRIQSCLRASDTVARMGGDEFTVVLSEMADATHLEGLLQKLLHTLGSAFVLQGESRFVSASIGVTIYPLDATEIEELFKNADQALYVAKAAGRNRFSFFTPALQEAAQRRVRMTQDLREALGAQQFRIVYQPIVHMASGAVRKAEALLRWEHPQRGTVSPAEFIVVAESSGLIVEIGQWVFESVARQVLQWRQELASDFQVSVNKSPVQFMGKSTGTQPWGRTLQQLGLSGDAIVVEITEGLLLDSSDAVAQRLLDLGNAGIGIALDDFGTGYSSLAYLQRFEIDYLKIDRSFVRHLVHDSTELALCRAIIAMAHALGIEVIAEGVETEVHYTLLREAGCDYAQGYYLARPMGAADLEAFVRQR